jgi:hypothetical protein
MPDWSSFFPKHLAQEVASWGKAFEKFLENHHHLTLSLNRWSTHARDELYTFHTTTPKCQSFFSDGHIFKGVSVMGEALLGVAVKVFQTPSSCTNIWNTEMYQILSVYGPHKYSAVAGDGGPNVWSAKIKLNVMYPWILNIYDPCHNLNLFMKDVGKLFKDVSLQSWKWCHSEALVLDALHCLRYRKLFLKVKLWDPPPR